MGWIKGIKIVSDSTKSIPADKVNENINLKTADLF